MRGAQADRRAALPVHLAGLHAAQGAQPRRAALEIEIEIEIEIEMEIEIEIEIEIVTAELYVDRVRDGRVTERAFLVTAELYVDGARGSRVTAGAFLVTTELYVDGGGLQRAQGAAEPHRPPEVESSRPKPGGRGPRAQGSERSLHGCWGPG